MAVKKRKTARKTGKQIYDSDSYTSVFMPGKSIYQNDDRIFHRAECSYDYVESAGAAAVRGNRAVFPVILSSRKKTDLSISAYSPGVVRVNFGEGRHASDNANSMIVSPPAQGTPVRISRKSGISRVLIGRHVFELNHAPFCMRVLDSKGNVLFEMDTEKVAGNRVTGPLGFRRCNGNINEPFLSWRIRNDEKFFGLGEKWNTVEKTSTRATIWASDTCGTNTTDMSYKSVPVLFSTAGWGVMVHTSYRTKWEIGTFSHTAGSVLSESPGLDLFFFFAPSLKGLLERYTGLTGRPSMPPKWALGVWMSRCQYRSSRETDEVAARLRKEKIPCDVIHIDPLWMKTHYYFKIGVDACDFVRNDRDFPDLPGLFARYMANGFNTCLWINPYIPEGTPMYREAKRRGYLLTSSKGGIARLEHGNPVGMLDFSNQEAKAWWKGRLLELVRDGASVFKPDYGDRVPEDALFHNGRTGKEMHNLYLHLFAETAFEAAREGRGEGIVWRRAGYIGSQRYPGTWAGDTQASWEGMRGAMRGGLSAGCTGEAFWSHDIGGFTGPKPSVELYCRWAQFGMLSPLTRFHGTTPREPWHYGDPAMAVVKYYARLRYSLIPYLLAASFEACARGVPLMRHMALEFNGEPGIDSLDDQYILGPDILVAPVLGPGVRRRRVYLPAGRWFGLETPGPGVEGGRFVEVKAPLERIPLFVREGAVIPRYTKNIQHLKGQAPEEIRLDIYPGAGTRTLVVDEECRRSRIMVGRRGAEAALSVNTSRVKIRAVFCGEMPQSVSVNGRATGGRVTKNGLEVVVG